jgi:hypothetical protein
MEEGVRPRGRQWNGKRQTLSGSLEERTYPVIRGRLGLGPRSNIASTSPSRGEYSYVGVGKSDVRLRVVPHFALGPIADVSDSTSSGGDPLVLRVDDMDRWFDVRGLEISDIGITSPSCRMGAVTGRV